MGDVTDRVQLTPVAIREGQAFADTFFGNKPRQVDYSCIPSAVFSHPPLAGVGMTEGEARNKLGSVKTFTSDFRPMKNVLAGRNERSLYKLVLDGATDEIVGIHMIGPDAPEILQAAAVAVKAKLKKADFDDTVRASSDDGRRAGADALESGVARALGGRSVAANQMERRRALAGYVKGHASIRDRPHRRIDWGRLRRACWFRRPRAGW